MSPAATEGGVGECLGHGCSDATGTVGDDEDDTVGIEPAADQRAQQHSPGPRGLAQRLAIVEQLPRPSALMP